MPFTQIDDAPLRAKNLSKTGAVYYLRWRDIDNNLYVQITRIVGGSGAGNGTFSKFYYPYNDIGQGTIYNGYDPTDGTIKTTSDKNMPGFLRAAKNDIIRRMDEQTEAGTL